MKRNTILSLLAVCILQQCGMARQDSTKAVFAQLTQAAKAHPMVSHSGTHDLTNWIGCTTCYTLWGRLESVLATYLPVNDEHEAVDGKVLKGALHFFCFFRKSSDTCMRYIQTYYDLVSSHMLTGVLGQEFFCYNIMHACENYEFTRSTLQYFNERVDALKPTSAATNNFTDNYYVSEIRGKESNLIDYKILHLSDLSIDLDYVSGASTKCRQFRCCHAGTVDPDEDNPAGPFGSRGCDLPLAGAKVLLTKLKESLIAEYSEINMVIVTGNVVSDQAGQMNAAQVSQTVIDAYAMIQEVFPSSFIFPVIGSQDTYPSKFFPFMNRNPIEKFQPNISKKLQYEDQNSQVITDIVADWTSKYPFNDDHRLVPSLSFSAVNTISKYGYYKVDEVPFNTVSEDEIDQSTGDVIATYNRPEVLSDTIFVALNTLACQVSNMALFETVNDPGNQLTWLEKTLGEARQAGKTVIIAGNLHPGSASCNRQWSQRYSSLIDAFQDIVRVQLFGGANNLEEFELFRDLDSGKPIAVGLIGAEFNPYKRDLSARLLRNDKLSNFPIQITTWSIPGELPFSQDEITVSNVHTYPITAELMFDLSPGEYSAYVEWITENESRAMEYLARAHLGDQEYELPSSCNEVCRKRTACNLNYAVNEFTVLCNGYHFDYNDTFLYFMGAMQNPWYDKRVAQ